MTQRDPVMGPDLLDSCQGAVCGGVELTRIYRTGSGELVRVRARRDFYLHQSYARSEVLSPDRTWTFLLEDLPSRWHPGTAAFSEHNKIRLLEEIATALADRAHIVLSFAPTIPGSRS